MLLFFILLQKLIKCVCVCVQTIKVFCLVFLDILKLFIDFCVIFLKKLFCVVSVFSFKYYAVLQTIQN